jgi:hypothetical protein
VVAEATRRAWAPPALRTIAEAHETPRDELHVAGFGVRVHVADYTERGAGATLRSRLPRELIAGPGASPALRYEIREGVIHRNGHVRYEGPTEPGVRWVGSDIDAEIAMRATEGLFVHAGVVARAGRAILIPGKSGVGKSTLVAALVAAGATYYSDEYAPIDADGRVHPYARAPSPRHPEAPPYTVTDEPRPALRPAVILVTSFVRGARWAPEQLTGARAVLPLVDNTVLARERPAEALAMARRLGPDVVTLSGPRPEASAVAGAILAAVDAIVQG